MSTGTTGSLPDSGGDGSGNEKGWRYEPEIAQLQNAVRPKCPKSEASPERFRSQYHHGPFKPERSTMLGTEPTFGARKIFSSQSDTESTIKFARPTLSGSLTHMNGDSNQNNLSLDKLLLVRKKSGELVRPALRTSSKRRYNSLPGMSTNSRSVHFNDFDNQTRYFFQIDNAMDILVDSPPVKKIESEAASPFGVRDKATRDIKLTNFPQDDLESNSKPVRVERLFLSSDNDVLVGTIAVQNLSFQKVVVARFTLDHWKTTSELVAEYKKDLRNPSNDDCDRFTFHMDLSDIADVDSKSILLCARYNVDGQDYWDNNDNMNYHIEFVRIAEKCTKPTPTFCPGARPLRAAVQSSYSRCRCSFIDRKFGARTDVGLARHFDTSSKALENSRGVDKFAAKLEGNGVFFTGLPQLHYN